MVKRSLILLLFFSIVFAHENQLSGLVYTQPQTPLPKEPFQLTVELVDPEGSYIPNAILNLAIPDSDTRLSLSETQNEGIYQATLTLNEGRYLVALTEATLEGEANTTEFGLRVGSENLEFIEILFPASEQTNTARVWLLSLVAVLILASFILIWFARSSLKLKLKLLNFTKSSIFKQVF